MLSFRDLHRPADPLVMVNVWDKDRTWAQRLAKACDIPNVVSKPEDCIKGADAIIIIDQIIEGWRPISVIHKTAIDLIGNYPNSSFARECEHFN